SRARSSSGLLLKLAPGVVLEHAEICTTDVQPGRTGSRHRRIPAEIVLGETEKFPATADAVRTSDHTCVAHNGEAGFRLGYTKQVALDVTRNDLPGQPAVRGTYDGSRKSDRHAVCLVSKCNRHQADVRSH